MTDASAIRPGIRASLMTPDTRTRRRNAAEARFRLYGRIAIAIGLAALVVLMGSVLANGLGAFRQSFLTLEVHLDEKVLDKSGARDPEAMKKVTTIGYGKIVDAALKATIAAEGIVVEGLTDKDVSDMISKEAAALVRNRVLADPALVGQTVAFKVLANGRIDGYLKGRVTMDSAERDSNVSPRQLELADALVASGILAKSFNAGFITGPDASELRPEAAGMGIAILGSAYMMLVVLFLSLPIGVAASIYLEEFAPKNTLTDAIEVNVSNLAAVPSIVFGLLGLAVFIAFFGMPRSAPVVGGLVLTLLTLPTIIIASRAALKAVPPSIREAALGMGASRIQTVAHHVLPLAMPGMLTGAIIGMARALGESAPLLMIGMVAFIVDVPKSVLDPATVLPVQVFLWSDLPERSFVERTSGAIIVLLAFLLVMNATAVVLRNRFEKRW